jgi:hypothetical protein
MTPLQRHVLFPALVPLLFLAVAATPVELLGCRNRGLLALGIALASALAGLYAAMRAATLRRRADPLSPWWLATAIILAIAPIALLILA